MSSQQQQQQQLMLGHHIMLQQQNLIRQQHQVLSSSNSQALSGMGGNGGLNGFFALNFPSMQMMDAPGFPSVSFGHVKTDLLDPSCSSPHTGANGGTAFGATLLPHASGTMPSDALQSGQYASSQRAGPSSTRPPNDGLMGPAAATGVADPNFDERDHMAMAAMFNDIYHSEDLIGYDDLIGETPSLRSLLE